MTRGNVNVREEQNANRETGRRLLEEEKVERKY